MKLDKLNQWLTLAANIGLIAGFVLIALQLQQNTRAIELQAISLQTSSQISGESTFMGEDVASAYAVAALRPSELSEGQVLALWGYLSTTMLGVVSSWDNYQAGIVSKDQWEAQCEFGAIMVNWPFGRVWWEEVKRYYEPPLIAEIERCMAQAGTKDLMATQVRNLIEGARNLPDMPDEAGQLQD